MLACSPGLGPPTELVKDLGKDFTFLNNMVPFCSWVYIFDFKWSYLISRLIQMKQVYFKFAACHQIIKGSSKHHKICLEDFVFV